MWNLSKSSNEQYFNLKKKMQFYFPSGRDDKKSTNNMEFENQKVRRKQIKHNFKTQVYNMDTILFHLNVVLILYYYI